MPTTREVPAAARSGVIPADTGAGGAGDRRTAEVDGDDWMRPDPLERWRLLRPARI